MKYSILNLLCTSLIPELGSDITAGTSCNEESVLVAVAAVRALPDELAVILDDLNLTVVAALLAIITLGVKLGVHDVIVDIADDLQDGFEVILHVRDLDVADGTAGGKRLELRLEAELFKRVNMLGNVDVVAVCDIRLIRDARDDAEAALEALCELVRSALERRAVQTEADGGLCLPFFACSVHILHDSCLLYTSPSPRDS